MFCFIILHYKNIADTLECLQSIRSLEFQEKIKVIVVDNNTTTIEEQKILKQKSDIFIRMPSNVGFAQANNQGCRKAIAKYHPNFLIVINNDIVIYQKDFLKRLVEDDKKYSFDMLGPKIITNGGDSVNPFPAYQNVKEIKKAYYKTKLLVLIYEHKSLFWLLKKYLRFKNRKKEYVHLKNGRKLQKNVALHGCAIIFSKKYYKKYKEVFYPDTFLYHEEEFLDFRRKKDNLLTIYDPKLEVFHKEGASLESKFKEHIREKNLFRYREIQKSLKKLLNIYNKGESENEVEK